MAGQADLEQRSRELVEGWHRSVEAIYTLMGLSPMMGEAETVEAVRGWVQQRNELLTALKDARELLRREYPDDSLAEGNWPTMKPKLDALDAAIAKAEDR